MSALLGTYQQWRGRSNLCRALIWAQRAPSLHDFARNKGKICDEIVCKSYKLTQMKISTLR
jgi:hypothetical protein